MVIRSLGRRTDLIFAKFSGSVIDKGSYTLIQTPSNPGYHRGHKKLVDDLTELRNLFRKADDIIEPLSYRLMLKGGMTEQQISMYVHRGVQTQLHERVLGC